MISKLKFIDKFREVKNLEIIENKSDVKRLSKDFYKIHLGVTIISIFKMIIIS